MKARTYLMLAGLATLALPLFAFSQAQAERPQWDQKKAVAAVKRLTELEQSQSKPWDKTAWMTDVDAAVARARKENKPIFLYFYVSKGGPATAKC